MMVRTQDNKIIGGVSSKFTARDVVNVTGYVPAAHHTRFAVSLNRNLARRRVVARILEVGVIATSRIQSVTLATLTKTVRMKALAGTKLGRLRSVRFDVERLAAVLASDFRPLAMSEFWMVFQGLRLRLVRARARAIDIPVDNFGWLTLHGSAAILASVEVGLASVLVRMRNLVRNVAGLGAERAALVVGREPYAAVLTGEC